MRYAGSAHRRHARSAACTITIQQSTSCHGAGGILRTCRQVLPPCGFDSDVGSCRCSKASSTMVAAQARIIASCTLALRQRKGQTNRQAERQDKPVQNPWKRSAAPLGGSKRPVLTIRATPACTTACGDQGRHRIGRPHDMLRAGHPTCQQACRRHLVLSAWCKRFGSSGGS